MSRKSLTGSIVLLILFIQNSAFANMWGTGLYGGMQQCPTDVRAGGGGVSESDLMEEIRDESKEVAEQLKNLKQELNGREGLTSEIRKREKSLSLLINESAISDVRSHLISGRSCGAWTGMDDQAVTGQGTGAAAKEPSSKEVLVAARIGSSSSTPDSITVPEKLSAFRASEWKAVCEPSGGNKQIISRAVCTSLAAVVTAPAYLDPVNVTECTTDMEFYKKSVLRRIKIVADIARLEAERDRLKKAYRAASKQFKKDLKDGVYEDSTEGDYCVGCDFQKRQAYKREPDWSNVAANIGVGLLGIYMGQRQTKMIAEYNSAQGFPTQNYASIGYGFPYIMNGLYGALGGGTGSGAYGCGSTIGGGGNWNGHMGMNGPYGAGGAYPGANGNLWGYPQGMWGNPQAGGMFNAGFSPWGMNGMGQGGGGFNPYGMGAAGYGVAAIPAMMGGGGGFPAQFGGAIGGGFGGAIGGGFPAMMGGGFPAQFGGAVGGGFPAMMGGGFPAQFGGAVGGGFPAMMGGGFPAQFGGAIGGGIGGAIGGGFPAQFGGGQNYLGQMQMQQQMLQMQMQQQQLQLQQYNQYIQNETRRQQTLSSLNMELSSLMFRIQQVQYGGGSVGGGVNFGIGGSIGVGGAGYGGVNYNGNGSYIFNPGGGVGGPGGTPGCVGLSCSPTGAPGGVNTGAPSGPSR